MIAKSIATTWGTFGNTINTVEDTAKLDKTECNTKEEDARELDAG